MASGICIAVFGLLAASIAVDCACPDGWLTHGINCYFFSHDSEDWPGAMEMCALAGGTLVEIETQTEGHYLSNQAKLSTASYWFAMSDLLIEGEWMWAYSKENLNSTGYTHWLKGEPDNHNHNQNCAFIDGATGRWGDGTCHGARNYICEKNSGDAGIIIG